jgi:putative IMPACT (imprinted ancient) family translation regulator
MNKDLKNVMLVVSRWYGGIQLHGDRFKHISNAGREALQNGGFLPDQGSPAGKGNSKKKSKKRK